MYDWFTYKTKLGYCWYIFTGETRVMYLHFKCILIQQLSCLEIKAMEGIVSIKYKRSLPITSIPGFTSTRLFSATDWLLTHAGLLWGSTEPDNWTRQLNLTTEPDNWTRQLNQATKPDNWTRQLNQTTKPDNWTRQLNQTTEPDNWTRQLNQTT